MKEVILKFNLDTGEVDVEAKGFTGSSCKDGTAFLEKALGQSKDFQKKASWYATNMQLTGAVKSHLCG